MEGYGFGAEKAVYYMNKWKYKDNVIALILIGFCDTVGTQEIYEKKIGKTYYDEALDLQEKGLNEHFLSDLLTFAGEIPISSQTYFDFFSKGGSILSTVMSLRNGRNFTMFANIHLPILGIMGDDDE